MSETSIRYHATLQDLGDQELHGALNGVSYLFDTVSFIEKLREDGLLRFDEARQAFYLIPEVEDPDDQAFADFWGWVEALDQEAQEREWGM